MIQRKINNQYDKKIINFCYVLRELRSLNKASDDGAAVTLNTKVFFYMKDTLPMSLSGQSVTDVTDVNTKIEQCHKSMCTAHHS